MRPRGIPQGSSIRRRMNDSSDVRSAEQKDAGIFGTTKADLIKKLEKMVDIRQTAEGDTRNALQSSLDGRRHDVEIHLNAVLVCGLAELKKEMASMRAQILMLPTTWYGKGE